jgi:hypothetical protein
MAPTLSTTALPIGSVDPSIRITLEVDNDSPLAILLEGRVSFDGLMMYHHG